jgi:eukaryotic-like serine/threonine-protein kinase
MLEGGQRVGRYRIVRFLGAGAMGEVYLAEDPHIERRLAIKTVRLAGGRPQDIEDRKRRLLREARAAGRLLHPHVVALFDAGEEEGVLFLAFEFVEGCDLAGRLETGEPPTLREVLRITRQVAEALDYAHRQGIVHRDIKPSNILIDTAGHVKVADFGIAKVAGQNTELTVAGSVMGSPQYLSPEQIRGDELDGRSDVFSLGVVLYELLSGRRPFDGETITTLVYQILHKDPSISELRSVPLRLEQLLHRMLAKDRDERLATAGLVAEELAAIERNLPEETLDAPAAPAGASLDVTRVLSSRSLPPGAVAGEAGGAASAGGAGSPAAQGGAFTRSPASSPPAPVAAVPLAPAPAAGAMPGERGERGERRERAATAAAAPQAPMPAPAVPGSRLYTQAAAAAAVAAGPPPAQRSSNARIWLALAAVLLLFCGVVGAGALWLWQHYGRRAGQGISQLSQWSSAPSTSSTSSTPLMPSTSSTPRASSGSGSSTAAGVPPATLPGAPAAPAAASAGAGNPGIRPSPPASTSAPSAPSAPPAAPPAPASRQIKPPVPPANPPATTAGRTPAASSAGSGPAARGSTSAESGNSPAPTPAPARGRSNIASSKPEASGSASPAAASRGTPATASPSPGDTETAAGAGAGQPAGQDRDAAGAAGSGSTAAATAPGADRVIRSGLELAFRVNPPDAFVLLDGAVIGKAQEWSGQKGGRSFTLPGTGSHQVKIKRQGMKDYRITVEASDARGVTPVTVSLQPLPAAQIETSDLQTVRVREAIALRVEPDVNAVVLVDGTAAGPVKKFAGRFGHGDEWLSLPPGTHRVTLVAPGYGRRDLAVEVSPGAEKARQKIDVQLSPAAGSQ